MGIFTEEEMNKLNDMMLNDSHGALKYALELQKEHPNDNILRYNWCGIITEIAYDINDIDLLEKGTRYGIEIFKQYPDDLRIKILYEIANAKYGAHKIKRLNGDNYDVDHSSLIASKYYFREVLKLLEKYPDLDIECKTRVNYGNCLSSIGRNIEAIYQYKIVLSIDSNHLEANLNYAQELEFYSDTSGSFEYMLEATKHLYQTIKRDNFPPGGYYEEMKKYYVLSYESMYEKLMRNIMKILDVKESTVPSAYENNPLLSEMIRYYDRHNLMLNFYISTNEQSSYYTDELRIRILEEKFNSAQTRRLARSINALKDDYSHARFLIFEAKRNDISYSDIDSLSNLSEIYDNSVYGIRSSKIKNAFISAYNILDKVAFFLNDYLKLGIDEKEVSFLKIWKSTSMHEQIKTNNNYPLFALYDLSKDFQNQGNIGHFNYLTELRHALTHRFVVLHEADENWLEDNDPESYHMVYRDFYKKTLELLLLVKSALVYLTMFVNLKEGNSMVILNNSKFTDFDKAIGKDILP